MENGLEKLNVKGPFVLVGNQSGSMNMRVFAARAIARGEDVRAIIHLEPYIPSYAEKVKEIDGRFKDMERSVRRI